MIKPITDTNFGRSSQSSPAKMDITQMVVPSGASGATLTQTEDVTIEGVIRAISVGVNNNTGNKTVDVSIIDADGSVLFTGETVAEDTASAPTIQQFMTVSGTDLPLYIVCAGKITVSAVMSGDPSTSTGLIDVSLYLE